MSTQAIIVMVLFLGGVWGGFITLLTVAMRRDRQTAGEDELLVE